MKQKRNNNSHGKTLFDNGSFIGWDGEGITIQGQHRYVLMMNSLGHKIFNKQGLTTDECFRFLLSEVEPNRIHVCFASGYDINKMLRTVPKKYLKELWESDHPIVWKTYRMLYRKAKSFWLSDGVKSITLWDNFSFFQCSFIEALDSYFPDIHDEELEIIRAMKKARSTFKLSDLPEIEYYCSLELKWLVLLMDKFREYLRRLNIKVNRWDGAGAVAAALLRREKVKEHMNQDLTNCNRALRAYYGGRIESTCVGFNRARTWQYDLRSAYPAVIATLPSLKNGVWKKQNEPKVRTSFSLHRVQWSFDYDAPFYPFPYRQWNDAIVFPKAGCGWYWGIEVQAAQRFAQIYQGSIVVLESWSFICFESGPSPFEFVHPFYDERRTLKRNGDGAEKILKLGLNSIYGKLQQQLGGTEEKFPTYFQPEWSGYITAATRAKLLEAALEQPDAVLMFATDALFTCQPLHKLKIGEELGQWEKTIWDAIMIVQPGVYYLYKNGKTIIKSRGFGIDALADSTRLVKAWKRGIKVLAIPTTRYVTLGSALRSKELWEYWGEWRTVDRELVIDGFNTKRCMILEEWLKDAANEVVPTMPRPALEYEYLQEESRPFQTLWNRPDDEEEELIDDVPFDVWMHETKGEEYFG